MGPHPNQKQALNLSAVFAEAWGSDRRRLGPRQTVFFKFNTKYLCGIGVGSRFDADSQKGAVYAFVRRSVKPVDGLKGNDDDPNCALP